jgi:hypothetical protein
VVEVRNIRGIRIPLLAALISKIALKCGKKPIPTFWHCVLMDARQMPDKISTILYILTGKFIGLLLLITGPFV